MFACHAPAVPKDPADLVLPLLQPMLADGQQLRGWCLATEQSAFSGHTTVVGVTDRRLSSSPSTGSSGPRASRALAAWLHTAG
jgi:hypothetical protein